MNIFSYLKKLTSVLLVVALLTSLAISTTAASVFKDVPDNAYFSTPVSWAYENGITSGTSATSFSPSATCTRSQVVTFLWRAFGSPEPTTSTNPFSDISKNDYFYKAVLWAYENNITKGTSAKNFSPFASCTRGEVVTLLWRTEGEPFVANSSSFVDVPSAAFFYNAVSWAVENEITNGVGGQKFAPNETCTRAQIVTFLYRNFNDEILAPNNAYEHLKEWLLANGKTNGSTVSYTQMDDADWLYGLCYSADSDYLYVYSCTEDESGNFIYCSLNLDSYFYGFLDDYVEIYGYLEAAEYTDNSPLAVSDYIGEKELKHSSIELTRVLLCTQLDFLNWVLATKNVGITLSDLGFSKY